MMEKKANNKLKIKKGDSVIVISGNYKGKSGRVLEIIRKDNKAIVEGINIVSKHTKPTTDTPQGGITKKEAPIHLSNLMLLDPKSGKPTRVGYKTVDGKKVRFAKKSNEVIGESA